MDQIILNDLKEILSVNYICWERFIGKTVLVTGANGMLPSYLVYTLLYSSIQYNLGIRVIAQVRNETKGREIFADYLDNGNFKLLVQDVCMPYSISEHIDFIIHAASQASPKYYAIDPIGTLMTNVDGTKNILQLAVQNHSESVLYFSSAEIYGKTNNFSIKEEDYGSLDPTSIRSCYAESKRMGEQLCCAWNTQYNTHAKWVRPFHTYGPNMSLDDGRVFSDFVRDIVNDHNIILKSSGDAKRAFCYITDATIAFLKILLDGEDGIAYNIGNPTQEISIKDLANKLIALFPEKHLKLSFQTENKHTVENASIKNVLPNIDRISKLGWIPKVTIEDGFKRVIEHKSRTCI